ncbi:hypothetical protein HPY42_01710 [Coprothermobacteraceae bacterium]|nr:hypothetical protein [Coprothermobacteraceae bacterium]
MRIDGSGSIDPRHVELVKRVAERFEIGGIDRDKKVGKRDTSLVLARVLQQLKAARAERLIEAKTKADELVVSDAAIAKALIEKTKEDAEA